MEHSHKYGRQVKNDSLIDIDLNILNNFEECIFTWNARSPWGFWEGILPTETNPFPPQFLHNQQAGSFPSTIFNIPFRNLACFTMMQAFLAFHQLHEATITLYLSFAPYYRQQDGTQRVLTSQVIGNCPYRHLEVGLSLAMFSPDPMFEVSCPCPWGHKRKELPANQPTKSTNVMGSRNFLSWVSNVWSTWSILNQGKARFWKCQLWAV